LADTGRLAVVTGANGFVGSHLVDLLLSEGWAVRCVVRERSDLRWIARDRVSLHYLDFSAGGGTTADDALLDASIVFHLAAVTSARSDDIYERVNVGGTRRIVEALQRAPTPPMLVFCSSQAAAGPARLGRPTGEDDDPAPVSAYGRSKLEAERVVRESGIRYSIVRPPTVYGPRDTDVLEAFRLARRGIALRIASESQRISIVHVTDLVRGILRAADAPSGGMYFLTDGVPHTWRELVDGIGRAVGRAPRVIPVPPPLAVSAAVIGRAWSRLTGHKPLLTPDRVAEMSQADWSCDDSRARSELGYKSQIPLERGLMETAEWYRSAGWLKQ
jgi:nucleoside-diphosphate-sugar epimerase